MNQYLAWFDEIPDEELGGSAGGKGASLCRMSRAGLPVPKGFIVRSEMFNAFMEQAGLWDFVFEKLEEIDFSSDASLIAVSAAIRRHIIDTPVPQDMAMELVSHGLVDLDGLVTARYPLERIEDGFRALMDPEENLKIMIQIHDEKGQG